MLIHRGCHHHPRLSQGRSTPQFEPSTSKPGNSRPFSCRRTKWQRAVCADEGKERPSTSRQPDITDRRSIVLMAAALPLLHPRQLDAQVLQSFSEPARTLPQGYEEFAGKLAAALREAIETDLSDAEERQVRKKADPAKNLVKGWLSEWKDAQGVQGEASYTQLSGTIKELGEFYRKKGQRARLPRSLGNELLAKLAAAENALPLPGSADGKQNI
ncbi:hypothetical protein COCSUDRAFT_52532 [Coccomyxa subellipsoidea C-169]|uniref:Uncharacterized protein n=1 Tax=Coccomyxa subellipsoidea (strain C-169) TaxID=574566 RepID=I0Z4U7_COCSC|nr:hypothetical protein COCSUDRAFT_52532 [Coccomyxa subellipsoidea C-169]EIE25666.1 hypothetical protein COCSUDRAFT_52532 [Coccomyxa subellipsoidea C-169]|eukprot:XP_005650210.1 hypothetical protein COCSUDRAFT_52532 [Coccomyxa subellipsoidea C-169]